MKTYTVVFIVVINQRSVLMKTRAEEDEQAVIFSSDPQPIFVFGNIKIILFQVLLTQGVKTS